MYLKIDGMYMFNGQHFKTALVIHKIVEFFIITGLPDSVLPGTAKIYWVCWAHTWKGKADEKQKLKDHTRLSGQH